MTTSAQQQCPICRSAAKLTKDHSSFPQSKIECVRCGLFALLDTTTIESALNLDETQIKHYKTVNSPSAARDSNLFTVVSNSISRSRLKTDANETRSVLSHALRKLDSSLPLENPEIANLVVQHFLPNPTAQSINLIRFLGANLRSLGSSYTFPRNNLEALRLGAEIGLPIGNEYDDVCMLAEEMQSQNLVILEIDDELSKTHRPLIYRMRLSLKGWNEFENLDREFKSKYIFVAMKFLTDENIDFYFQKELFPRFLSPAIEEIGFKMTNNLLENPQAGNLHARLETSIKQSRLVIAELSHHNNGAYWEAGFAKGLGKPVIYMFCKAIGGDKPHFDVGSDQIIFWDKNNPENAAQALKDIIRNTLFDEAKQSRN